MESKEMLKWILTFALIGISVFLIYNYSKINTTYNIESLLKENKKQVGYAEALQYLTKSEKICIVEDITGTQDPIRKNIMDCGINFASTLPIYEKNMKIYAVENGKCFSSEGEREIPICSNEIKEQNCFVFFIASNETIKIESYENMLLVPVGEKLKETECMIIS